MRAGALLIALLLGGFGGPHAASTRSIGLRPTLAQLGYVGVSVEGTPGERVQLSEQTAGGTVPLAVVTLSPQRGVARVPHLLAWSCASRIRVLLATAEPPGPDSPGRASVRTPSCAHRLRLDAVHDTALVGRSARLTVRDTWNLGAVAYRLCVSAPGGVFTCGRRELRGGVASRAVKISLPRPGGWRVLLESRYGQQQQRQIWAAHPDHQICLLAAGDSEMQILDDYIAQDLRGHGVRVTSDARQSTALTSPFKFDWISHARAQAASIRPDVTVMFIGANEGFPVQDGGRRVNCCSAAWSRGYAGLVEEMMASYLRGQAGRVYWFLLPAPRPANFHRLFDAVNAGLRIAAARFPNRVVLMNANAFFTPGDRYRDYMTYRGRGFVIHESDGIHLSYSADRVVASLLLHQLLADRVIR